MIRASRHVFSTRCFGAASKILLNSAASSAAATNSAATSSAPSSQRWTGSAAVPLDFFDKNTEAAKNIYGTNFTISERCWTRVHSKNQQEGILNSSRFLRLAVESGGCHGYMYKFQFDADLDPEQDVVFFEDECEKEAFAERVAKLQQQQGGEASSPQPALVVVDKSTADCMRGAVFDYHTELKGSAFVVVGNEKVDHLCACAMSFSVKH